MVLVAAAPLGCATRTGARGPLHVLVGPAGVRVLLLQVVGGVRVLRRLARRRGTGQIRGDRRTFGATILPRAPLLAPVGHPRAQEMPSSRCSQSSARATMPLTDRSGSRRPITARLPSERCTTAASCRSPMAWRV